MATIYWGYTSGTLTLSSSSVSGTKKGSFNSTPTWTSGSDVPWFSVRESITTVVFSDAISMGNTRYMFCGCSALTTFTNPSNFDVSGSISFRFMFWGCSSLTSIPFTIPSTCTTMFKAFYGCTALTSLASSIPDSVTSLYQCFYGCTNLTGIITINATPTETEDAFAGTTKAIHLVGSSGNLQVLAATSANSNVDYYEKPIVTITGSRNSSTPTTINLTITATKKSWTSFVGITLTENGSSVSVSGTSGTWTITRTGKAENTAFTYVVKVTDTYGTSDEIEITIPTGFKTINVRSGGKSIAFGTAAPATSKANGQMTIAMDVDFTGDLQANGNDADIVVEYGVENGWTYRKWASGKREAWKTQSWQGKLSTSNGGWYCDSSSGQAVTDFPTDLFTSMPLEFSSAVCDGSSTNVDTCIMGANRSLTNFGNVLFHRGNSYTTTRTYIIYMYAIQI